MIQNPKRKVIGSGDAMRITQCRKCKAVMFGWLVDVKDDVYTWRGWGEQCRCKSGLMVQTEVDDGVMAVTEEEPWTEN